MSDYDWIVEQLKLCREPHSKHLKVAEIIVNREGNQSEKHGITFGLVPEWTAMKTDDLIRQAEGSGQNQHLKHISKEDGATFLSKANTSR